MEIRSLSDWRGLYRQFLEVPEVWELAPKSAELVAEGLGDYRTAAQLAGGDGWSAYDFKSLAGWNGFLESGPLSWTGGIGSTMGALESLDAVDADTLAAFRSAVEAESVIHGMRYGPFAGEPAGVRGAVGLEPRPTARRRWAPTKGCSRRSRRSSSRRSR